MAIEKLVNGIKKRVGGLALGTALVLGSYGVSGCVEKHPDPELTYELCEESCKNWIDKCEGDYCVYDNDTYDNNVNNCVDECFEDIDKSCKQGDCYNGPLSNFWLECIPQMDSWYDDFGYCWCVRSGTCQEWFIDYSCPSESECEEIYEQYNN